MLPSKSISFLGLSPLGQCASSIFRLAPSLSYPQCPTSWTEHRFTCRTHLDNPSSRLAHSLASQSDVTYRIGAAFSAKGKKFNTKQNIYTFDHRQQSSKKQPFTGRPASGQDAFFVSNVGAIGSIAFGVADGVGGWSDSGIDSADFSHALCRYMAKHAQDNIEEQKLGARDLLHLGFEDVVADRTIPGGGSTACIAVGHSDGHLEVANLGDSGFMQFRLNAVHESSNPQTHAFNTPFQLSIIPPRILARSRIFGGMPLRDFPKDASITHHQVRHGDVLVFATDGVWDNLNSSELLQIVSRHMISFQAWQTGDEGTEIGGLLENLTLEGGIPKEKENTLQTMLAVAITGEAKAASLDTKRDGPFAREVHKFYPHEDYHGGKVDDITVVVAIVVDPSEAEKRVKGSIRLNG